MRCPRCGDEYEADVETCAECAIPLIPEGSAPPPRVDALLGTFHPLVADWIAETLEQRGIAFDAVAADGAVEVIVEREFRDDLRAELAVSWGGVINQLPAEERTEVMAGGGRQPGWYDAPEGGWIDREGRLQVDPHEEERRETDADRILGPSLLTIGAVLAIFGWYAGGSEIAIVLGVVLALAGALLPR